MPPPAELGGSQISSLLEALPGIASVLRSPVADALVKAIRGAAGLGEFTVDDAEELIRYAVRRGLIGPEEGDRVLSDIQGALKRRPPKRDRKSTRLNSSHDQISYAVFCLKKKKNNKKVSHVSKRPHRTNPWPYPLCSRRLSYLRMQYRLSLGCQHSGTSPTPRMHCGDQHQ